MRVVIFEEASGQIAKDCDMNPDTVALNLKPGQKALLVHQNTGMVDGEKVRVDPVTRRFAAQPGHEVPAYLVGMEVSVLDFI